MKQLGGAGPIFFFYSFVCQRPNPGPCRPRPPPQLLGLCHSAHAADVKVPENGAGP